MLIMFDYFKFVRSFFFIVFISSFFHVNLVHAGFCKELFSKFVTTHAHIRFKNAIESNNPQAIRDLLREDIEVNAQDNAGHSFLHLAILNHRNKISQILIHNQDIDVNIQDNRSNTPLHLAILNKQENSFDLLLARKDIDITIKDEQDRTPLQLAAIYGHVKFSNILLERWNALQLP